MKQPRTRKGHIYTFISDVSSLSELRSLSRNVTDNLPDPLGLSLSD